MILVIDQEKYFVKITKNGQETELIEFSELGLKEDKWQRAGTLRSAMVEIKPGWTEQRWQGYTWDLCFNASVGPEKYIILLQEIIRYYIYSKKLIKTQREAMYRDMVACLRRYSDLVSLGCLQGFHATTCIYEIPLILPTPNIPSVGVCESIIVKFRRTLRVAEELHPRTTVKLVVRKTTHYDLVYYYGNSPRDMEALSATIEQYRRAQELVQTLQCVIEKEECLPGFDSALFETARAI